MFQTRPNITLFKNYRQTSAKVKSGQFTTSQLTILYNDTQCQSH